MTTDTSTPSPSEGDTAIARRRRRVKLSRKNDNDKRSRDEDDSSSDFDDDESCSPRKKPHLTGIKLQARYHPGVNMTRDELTAWRKEARRVRNRQSAAASRAKTRGKMDELEGKLQDMTRKYEAALKRIAELEGGAPTQVFAVPSTVSDAESIEGSPVLSPVSPISAPVTSLTLSNSENHEEHVNQKYEHIMDMIKRPAVSQ